MASNDIELFLDKYRISSEYNVERSLCQPVKHADNPIIVTEYPWEELYVSLYGSVIPKEDGTGFRMWYMSGAKGMQKEQFMCYAESTDGIEWHKVMSDANPYPGHKKTNILYGLEANVHGPCVVRNCHSDEPDERYLLMYDSYWYNRPEQKDLIQDSRWLYTATSPDGLHWSPGKGRPAIPGKSDCAQCIVWDPENRRYIAYIRGVRTPMDPFDPFASPYGEINRVRYVRAATSLDFLHWSEPIELMRADELDGDPVNHIHQFAGTRRSSQYIGLVSIFNTDHYFKVGEDNAGNVRYAEDATCETQLAVSRDGFDWNRLANRAVFLPRGTSGEWDDCFISTASSIVFDGERMLFYYAGSPKLGEGQGGTATIGLASSPRDRFQALRPRNLSTSAIIETKPLYLTEGDLQINADATHGQIVTELVDFEGKIINGFSKAESTVIESNGLDHLIRWQGKKVSEAVDEQSLFRRAVRIRFYLHQASLYAACWPLSRKEDV